MIRRPFSALVFPNSGRVATLETSRAPLHGRPRLSYAPYYTVHTRDKCKMALYCAYFFWYATVCCRKMQWLTCALYLYFLVNSALRVVNVHRVLPIITFGSRPLLTTKTYVHHVYTLTFINRPFSFVPSFSVFFFFFLACHSSPTGLFCVLSDPEK